MEWATQMFEGGSCQAGQQVQRPWGCNVSETFQELLQQEGVEWLVAWLRTLRLLNWNNSHLFLVASGASEKRGPRGASSLAVKCLEGWYNFVYKSTMNLKVDLNILDSRLYFPRTYVHGLSKAVLELFTMVIENGLWCTNVYVQICGKGLHP